MLMIRWYKALMWIGRRIVRPTGLKDRWGCNLGEDLDDWAAMRSFLYLERVEKLSGWEHVEVHGPHPTYHVTGGNVTNSTATNGTVVVTYTMRRTHE